MESENQLEGIVKEIFDAHQQLRKDPKSFIPVLENIKSHFNEDGKLLELPGATPVMHHEGVIAYNEAIKFLKTQKPVINEFYFNDLLQQSARDHANDIGPKGMTGHTGSDKSTYGERIERYCKWGGAIYESIDYSRREVTGEHVVAKLIVDDGIKSRNHRKVIFQADYKHIGIAEADHTEFGRVIVIDYGAQIISHKDYEEMQKKPTIEELKKEASVDISKISWPEVSRKIAEEINKVRKNPKHLIKQMERSLSMFKKYKILSVPGRETREFKEGAPAYIEAIEFCDKQTPVKEIKISQHLKKAAKDHIKDLEETGKLAQIGSDGSTPKDRMERYTGVDGLWSENLIFGGFKPREIVEYMLIADGDRSRGLRKNIFNPKLKLMGVACGPHPASGSVTVVDFVTKEIGVGEMPSIQIESTDEIPEELQKKLDAMGIGHKVTVAKGKGTTVTSVKEQEVVNKNGQTETNTKTRPWTARPTKAKSAALETKRTTKSKPAQKKPEIPKFGRKKANTLSKAQGSAAPKAAQTPQPAKLRKGVSARPGVGVPTSNIKRPAAQARRGTAKKPGTAVTRIEESKYEQMPDKVKPEDLEVFSDYSYDRDTDVDKPEGLKKVTCTTQILEKDEKREMIIRKQYYLEDGTELRVKSILPVKKRDKVSSE